METINKPQISRMSTIAIMVVPLVWLFEASAVGPILGFIPESFPSATPLSIKLIMTLPFIASFIFSIVSGVLATFIDKKKIILAGLLIYAITGVLPFWANSINQILTLRFFTGVGVGLIMPLTTAIIAENFDGIKRERLLGWCPALANVMNIFANFLTAFLLGFGWRYCFFSFLLVFVVFFIALGMPKAPPVNKGQGNSGFKLRIPRLPAIVWGMSVLMLFKWAFFGFLIFNISLLMVSTGMSIKPVQIAIVMITPAVGEFITGGIFTYVHRLFKKFTLFVGCLVGGGGFIMCAVSGTWEMLALAGLIVSLGTGAITPYWLALTAERTSPTQKDVAYGVLNSCIPLGYFLSPFIQEIYNIFIGSQTNYIALFQGAGISYIVYGIICLLLVKKFTIRGTSENENRLS